MSRNSASGRTKQFAKSVKSRPAISTGFSRILRTRNATRNSDASAVTSAVSGPIGRCLLGFCRGNWRCSNHRRDWVAYALLDKAEARRGNSAGTRRHGHSPYRIAAEIPARGGSIPRATSRILPALGLTPGDAQEIDATRDTLCARLMTLYRLTPTWSSISATCTKTNMKEYACWWRNASKF